MTNICAAIGLAQLENVNFIINKKRKIAQRYKAELKNLPIIFYKEFNEKFFSTYWMVNILTENENIRNKLRKHLLEFGVETRPTFNPVHLMPMYFNKNYYFPIAIDLSKRGINIPSYPELTQKDVKEICQYIKIFYEKY
jgi:perosamine synthetase